jgi:hypothetical protein
MTHYGTPVKDVDGVEAWVDTDDGSICVEVNGELLAVIVAATLVGDDDYHGVGPDEFKIATFINGGEWVIVHRGQVADVASARHELAE